MAKKGIASQIVPAPARLAAQPSSLLDTRVIYCGDNLEQLAKLPEHCIDLTYIDPPFNSNRNYEVFWGETKEKRAFEDRHESTKAYIDYMRPRCVQLARVLKKTGSFYYHCDWHASHYVKVMLDQIFGESNFVNEIIWKRQSAHKDVCNMRESEPGHRKHDPNSFVVRDLPWTVEKLRAIPHFEFENWAVIALGGIPNKVQVGDMGIDGRLYPVGTKPSEAATKGQKGQTDHMFADDWFPIQVKQIDKVGRPDIDQFAHAMQREHRQRGFFVSFAFSRDAVQECNRIYKEGRIIKLLTVQEILDEEHVQKM